ncbi:MAG: SpoVT / AbrB like domain protein [Rickettsiaceae bacterium]|jgi:AbrB family looped-hinge helix DNA binding protein|nr:SpoVT / AbrB like domain protein [Rickettsiaceae bacterium]
MRNNHSTVTSKGQITIPAAIREKMNLESGSKLEFIQQDDHILVIPINKSVGRLRGILTKPERSLSVEQMNAIIKEKHDRN